mgnify:CR=1 FL=1
MSVLFDGTSNSKIDGKSPISNFPLTLSAWFYSTSLTADQCLVSVGNILETSRFCAIVLAGAVPADPFRAYRFGTTARTVSSATAYPINQWGHAAGIFDSSFHQGFLNGVPTPVNTDAATASNWNNYKISELTRSTLGNNVVGKVAEVAIWNVMLTQQEIRSLSLGLCPLKIRPQSLVSYVPLLRDIADYERRDANLIPQNFSISDHPRIYY